jgi:hypothetical protein
MDQMTQDRAPPDRQAAVNGFFRNNLDRVPCPVRPPYTGSMPAQSAPEGLDTGPTAPPCLASSLAPEWRPRRE